MVLDYKNSTKENKDKLALSYDSLKEALKLKTQYLQSLAHMGFVDQDTAKRSSSGNQKLSETQSSKYRWYLLRAACVARGLWYFLVRWNFSAAGFLPLANCLNSSAFSCMPSFSPTAVAPSITLPAKAAMMMACVWLKLAAVVKAC